MTCLRYNGNQKRFRNLRGWQGVIRYSPDRTEVLCIFHRFKAMEVIRIRLELKAAYSVKMIYEELEKLFLYRIKKNYGKETEGYQKKRLM